MKISIITATYNVDKTLEYAIKSVLSQTYTDIEYIIIDGNSSDNTIDIISKYKNNIDISVSEPDDGIYDALNKGIKAATGDVIGFLHADDVFYDENSIAVIAQAFTDKIDAVYGDLIYVKNADINSVIRYWKGKPYSNKLLKSGWMPAHPTFFVRRKVYENIGLYDLNYKISADYDFILRFFNSERYNVEYIPNVITRMRVGGKSNADIKNIIRKSKEDYKALKNNKIGGIRVLLMKNFSKISQFFIKRKIYNLIICLV